MPEPTLDFTAIRSIATCVTPAETDLSDAIASNAELIASILRAQQPMNVSPLATFGVVAQLSGANADLVAGMGKTVAAHKLLAELRDGVGLRAIAYGGGMWKGDATAQPSGTADDSSSVVALARPA